jgi:xylulokinase
MAYLLGIDVGSTNLKAVLFDERGVVVAKGDTATQLSHPNPEHPDWAVWEPGQIWGGIAEAVKRVTAGVDASEIKGVAVTGMGMDGVPLDQDGNWLYPFISWHCPRTAPQQEWWLEQIGDEKQFGIGGDPIWTFNTALRLRWMQENEPAILEKTHKWVLIEDFVNFQLCGEFATDFSMASTTLLFDLKSRSWSDDLIDRSGIDGRLLCPPHPAGTVLGTVHEKAAAATGLALGTPVVLGGHDYCCGCLPTGAFKPGVVLDVLGTWEMVVATLDEPVLTSAGREMGVLVDCHVAKDKYTVMGATVSADMLEWFKREFGDKERQVADADDKATWDQLVELAGHSPLGSNGVFFLPHMSGSHCPVLDPKSAGTFAGLRSTNTRGDLMRSIIEGINYQSHQIVRGFESNMAVKSDHIVAIGGPTNNELLMQTKADIIGKPIQIPEVEESVPLGAAILAGIGTGVYQSEDEAFDQVNREGQVYEPDPESHERYQELFRRFEGLYPAMKGFYNG